MKALETFSQEELFTNTYYPWVGGSCIGSYFISTTSSHYDWAIKKIKAHQKNCR
ncbi:MAG: ClbS/DfsB family four-helix bundle protein [Eubacterium sp.]|nr:ClbS/DfsB family four-helix bundle protein [Eubacterium sp.]